MKYLMNKERLRELVRAEAKYDEIGICSPSDEEIMLALKRAWLEKLPAPEYTYDWEEHPPGYDDPCCCAVCRSYVSE